MDFHHASPLTLFAVVIWPCDGRKTALVRDHHIVFAVGAVDDQQIAALIPAAHDAHVGVPWIEYQVAGDGPIPGDGGAVAVLGVGPAAVADDVAASGDVVKHPVHE